MFDYEGIWEGTWGDMQKYGPVHRHHRRIFSDLFNQLPKSEITSIADIGCGEGSNLFFIRSQFPKAELFGFDISNTAIESAKANTDAKFSILNIQKEPPQRKFDLTFCSDVVEHLEDDLAAMRNIKHATNKFAVVATVQGRMRTNEDTIGHVRNYEYGELEDKLKSVGFEILKVVEWGYPFYSPLFRNGLELFPASAKFSYGKYSLRQKIVSHMLYTLFMLNSSKKGDVVFVLAKP